MLEERDTVLLKTCHKIQCVADVLRFTGPEARSEPARACRLSVRWHRVGGRHYSVGEGGEGVVHAQEWDSNGSRGYEHGAVQVCTSNISIVDPSRPMKAAGALTGVRG